MIFTIFLFFRKNEKTPETLDFTGFSGGVFGVPERIRTSGLSLRSCKDCFPFRHGISLSIPKNACIWAFVDVLHPTLSHVVPRKNPRP